MAADRMFYVQGDLNDPDSYQKLKTKLAQVDSEKHTGGNYLFYLAVADRFFGSTAEQIGKAGLAEEAHGVWRRVVVEKPFGHDLASAEALNQQLLSVLRRNADLPHRSFSRQRNGAEFFDVPFRERHV